jgi:hypothetical protein
MQKNSNLSPTFWSISFKFGVKYNHVVLMSICMLCENRRGETPASLTRINKVCVHFLLFSSYLGQIWRRIFPQVYTEFELVKNLYSESSITVGVVNELIHTYCTLIVLFFIKFGFKWFARNAVGHLWISWKQTQRSVPKGVKSFNDACTVKSYDIF